MKTTPLEMSLPITVKAGWFLVLTLEAALVFAGALYSPMLLLLAVGVGLTAAWVFRSPAMIACLFVFAIPLLPVLHVDLQPIAFWTFSGSVLFAAWLFWSKGGKVPQTNKPLWFFISFQLFFLVMATMVSEQVSISLHECFVKGVIWMLFFAVLTIVDERNLIAIILILIFSTLMMVVLAIPDLSETDALFVSTPMAGKRLGSFYQNANNFAIPFLITIPFLAAIVIKSNTARTYQVVGICVLLLSILIVVMTKSRSAYLATTVSLSVVLLNSRRGRTVLVFSIAGLIASLPWTGKTVLFLLRLEEGLSGRIHLWRAAWKIIREYPWIGTGPGTYESVKGSYILPVNWVTRVTHSSTLPGAAHNLFLTWGAELGIAAALILTGLWFYLIVRWFRMFRYVKGDLQRSLWLGSLAVLTGITARGWFESGLIVNDLSDCIYFFIPLLVLIKLENRSA